MLSSVSCLALAGIMERFVKEVGPKKVAAVVTDNAANAVKSRRLLKRIYSHIIKWLALAFLCFSLSMPPTGFKHCTFHTSQVHDASICAANGQHSEPQLGQGHRVEGPANRYIFSFAHQGEGHLRGAEGSDANSWWFPPKGE
jgi:hypothetical protein